MAGFNVAGAAEVHCGVGAGGALAFLGWSEGGVRVSVRPFWDDVKSDVTGPDAATDLQLMGSEMFVSLDLKIWNPAVWTAVASRANGRVGAAVAEGYYPNGAIGALAGAENLAFRLLVYKPYALKAGFAAAGQRNGFNAPFTVLLGPDDIDPVGTRAEKIRVVFRSLMQRSATTGDLLLFNNDYSGKPVAA